MKITLTSLLLFVFVACADNPNKKATDIKSNLSEDIAPSTTTIDTITSLFPIQIGNDQGEVKIVGMRTFENNKFTNSKFIIALNELQDFSISKEVNKTILIDSNKTVRLKDTIHSDYLNGAIIKTIEFDFVRSNTLYFKALLENPNAQKEILGRFNLFYRTNKKGKLYGWITDEIK